MSIMNIPLIVDNYWVDEGCFDVIHVSVNQVSMIVGHASWIMLTAAQQHQLIIELSAAFQGTNGCDHIATMS